MIKILPNPIPYQNLNNHFIIYDYASQKEITLKFKLMKCKHSPSEFKSLITTICNFYYFLDLGDVTDIILINDIVTLCYDQITLPLIDHHDTFTNKIFNYIFALHTQEKNLIFYNFFHSVHKMLFVKFFNLFLDVYTRYNKEIFIHVDTLSHVSLLKEICDTHNVKFKNY